MAMTLPPRAMNGHRDAFDSSPHPPFSRLLRDLREAQNPQLTQEELGRRIGRSRVTINRLEQGQVNPSLRLIEDLVDKLKLNAEQIRALHASVDITAERANDLGASLLKAITTENPLDVVVRQLAQRDIAALVSGWTQVGQAAAYLRERNLNRAKEEFEALKDHTAFSSLMRLYITSQLAEVNRLLGNRSDAELLTKTALNSHDLAHLPEREAAFLAGVLEAVRGDTELGRGEYQLARDRFEESHSHFLKLMPTAQANGATQDEWDIASLCLGMALRRLAKADMFLGETKRALTYCAKATEELVKASESSQKSDYLRRVLEIQAWAYTRDRDNTAATHSAIELHVEAGRQAKQVGDEVGEMKNFIYTGDDWRHLIEAYIYESVPAETDPAKALSPGEEVERAKSLHPDKFAEAIENAGHAYEQAAELTRRIQDPLTFGLLLRGQALIHVYTSEYLAADLLLTQAEQHESRYGLLGRLASIFEHRADIYWGQNLPEMASFWYEKALADLNRLAASPATKVNPAQLHQRERLRRRLDTLVAKGLVHAPITSALAVAAMEPEPRDAMSADDSRTGVNAILWHRALRELRSSALGAIASMASAPVASDDTTIAWLRELTEFEKLPGARLLAQNTLSIAYAEAAPQPSLAGAEASSQDGAERRQAHAERRAKFQEHVEQAHRGQCEINRDLCSRDGVELMSGHQPFMDRIEGAKRLLTHYGNGYALEASPYQLPLAFAVKGSRILIEIPWRMAKSAGLRVPHLDASAMVATPPNSRYWCYRIDSGEYAVKMRASFTTLYQVAAESIDATSDWLASLLEDTPASGQTSGL